MKFPVLLEALIIAGLLWITLPIQAHAYIDPGSGGVIISAILGFLAAIGYTFRRWFYKLRSLLGLSKTDDEA